ncbi:hypothetical protein CP996_26580 [Escherichia coli]|nr:hypothetical protein CP996_26580 [Escherichia coli]
MERQMWIMDSVIIMRMPTAMAFHLSTLNGHPGMIVSRQEKGKSLLLKTEDGVNMCTLMAWTLVNYVKTQSLITVLFSGRMNQKT